MVFSFLRDTGSESSNVTYSFLMPFLTKAIDPVPKRAFNLANSASVKCSQTLCWYVRSGKAKTRTPCMSKSKASILELKRFPFKPFKTVRLHQHDVVQCI